MYENLRFVEIAFLLNQILPIYLSIYLSKYFHVVRWEGGWGLRREGGKGKGGRERDGWRKMGREGRCMRERETDKQCKIRIVNYISMRAYTTK